MKYSILVLAVAMLFSCNPTEVDPPNPDEMVKETITFSSSDGLTITADTYKKNANNDFILLCHQAGYSRGEYLNTAPTFVENGYNCMAVDQRSGNTVNGIINQTALAATQQGLGTSYIDARPDIVVAIDKAYELNGNRPIYLLGSSYSSSWALLLGKTNPKVKAVMAFSPRENLTGINITSGLAGYAKPVFVTSAQSETATTTNLVVNIQVEYLTHYQSTRPGIHGASCLWSSTDGKDGYWTAILNFLSVN